MLIYTQYIGYVLHMENKNLDINLNTLGLSLTSARSHTQKDQIGLYIGCKLTLFFPRHPIAEYVINTEY